jgi:hypothetical protein
MPDALASHSIVSGMMASRPLTFDDRLLAEAVAVREQLEPAATDDRSANDVARAVGGDLEQRVIVRAESLPFASPLREAIRHVRQSTGLAVFVALILALLGGAAAARAVLGVPRDEPVNFFHVLAAALGLQTLLLIVWLVVMCLPRSAAPAMSIASLGGLVLRAGQALARRVHPGRDYAAAIAAISRTLARGSLGRWTFSAVGHALWLTFNIGCVAMIIFLLSTRQYAFAWETTILSADTYRPLTHAIAALPKLAGFDAPSDAEIDASQWKGDGSINTDASEAWSALLVGSIIVYGFGPRLLLLALSLGQRRAARRAFRLDVGRPEFARLRGALEPPTESTAIVDADAASPVTSSAPHPHPAAARPTGLPAIVGFELPSAVTGSERVNWPPRLHGVRWRDLGMADSREDRRRVMDDLSRSPEEPSALLIVCSLTTTPDRGAGAFLAELASTVSRPPLLALTGGQRLRERADHGRLDMRIDDWRGIARSAGIPAERVIEIDLDHLTHNSQSKLAAMINARTVQTSPGDHQRRLEEAFRLISEQAREHTGAGFSPEDQVALHRAIARLYGDHALDWRGMFHLPQDVTALQPARLAASLKSNAERFTALLPDRLRRSPKWLAAGAAAGALGCIAAAALISPVAISALPVWSLIGAAVSAVAQPSSSAAAAENEHAPRDTGDAIRSAALFAMLLELQGRDEPTITRVLDRAIDNDDAAPLPDADEAQRWLDDLRHRFDLALAREATS